MVIFIEAASCHAVGRPDAHLIGRTQKSIPKLYAIDPFAYLTTSLTAVNGPKDSRVAELLSWTNKSGAIA
ncbi:hypothetical protein [Rhizobium leguminosarum]|uniref:hypothetical protein n=1 Tax=Rhizobium leguminosarum TaxID=384 RepID=UPI001030E3FF|nr:hypothetical protein [Rhizobium leguminosarum]TAV82158.1 hypothetical protein ELI21_32890 [Rhizobium leguminosarum]TAV83139.1 hypothetical protein ELI22_29985 [Rhizobium leguminosarum]TAW25884.1 hypothetical protein ELI23_31500 [Rhizobium leguminosarum]TAX23213.1 hypothetical protein ELI04_30160 [Rhizobium leguminosarum]TAY26241.1 hypothetical protein ELH93_29650 [Rhizobium leguminosarum]